MEPEFEITRKNHKEDSLGQRWEQFSPYWPFLVVLVIIAIAGSWLYLQYKIPVYEAKTAVLIKDEKKGVDESKMVEGLNQLSGKKIIENEIEVITSRSLVNEVVNRLALYAPVYDEQPWLYSLMRPLPAYTTSPVRVEVLKPASIVETPRVDFKFDKLLSRVQIGEENYPLNQWVETKYGKLRFINNPVQRDSLSVPDTISNHNFYFALMQPKRATNGLMSRIQATSANKLTTVIDLRIEDEVPERSEDVLNMLVMAYTNAAIKDKNLLADSTLSILDGRIQAVSKDLESIEKKLENYRSAKEAIDISSQGKLFLQNVSDNDQKVSEVNMQLAALDEIESYVKSKDSNGEIVPSTLVVNDPLLNDRLQKLYQVELEYVKLKQSTAENHPMVSSLKSQIEKIKPGILENIKNQKASLEAGKRMITTSSNRYNSMLATVPAKERDLIEISRTQTLKTNLFNYLTQKREEIALSNSAILPDSRIVDKAESSIDPISPINKIVYLVGLVAAIIVFVAIIALRELMSSTILYRYEIENSTSAPVLTEIPHQKKANKNPLVINSEATGFIPEQFRKLRAALGYIGINQKRKKILVTSVIPGEGKSFIAANLGLTIALTGKKVLLLEYDLVNPGLSNKFNIHTDKGITTYLSGQAEPEEIIKRTEVCENLFLVPAGSLPVNPSEMIVSSKTEELLRYAEGIFDCIIVDSAPVGLRSDGYVLSKFCNATLYIVRHKKTPKKSVKRIDENNKINGLKNMAIVFNGVKPKGFNKNNYGYGYDYKYSDSRRSKRVTTKTV